MINENNCCQDLYGAGSVTPRLTGEKQSSSREPFVPDFWPGEEPKPNLPRNPADRDRQPIP